MNRTVNMLALLIVLITLSLCAKESTKKAPDFTIRNLKGKNYTLSKNTGKGLVIINFWATWCLPCVEEMKELKRIKNQNSNLNIEYLSISIDDAKTATKVKSVVRTRKYPFTILLDPNQKVYKKYHSTGVPHLFLIDKKGNIVYSHNGYRKGDEKELEKLIKEYYTK